MTRKIGIKKRLGVSVYRIVHEQYVIEYLMKTYPPFVWSTNVSLGVPHAELLAATVSPEEIRALKGWRANADAIVWLEDEVHIIEAFIRPIHGKLEQLLNYVELFKRDPEQALHWQKKIVPILLMAVEHAWYEARARELGVRVVKFITKEVEQYLLTLPQRHQRGFFRGLEPIKFPS